MVGPMTSADAGRATEGSPAAVDAGEHTWRVVDDVAWVMGEGRVALIDPTTTGPLPLLVHDPVAGLWPALAHGPVSVDRLREVADDIVEEDPEGFVHAALAMLREANLVVRVGGE